MVLRAKSKLRYGPSIYRAQGALLLTTFPELEPLCRPQADAVDGAPSKVEAPRANNVETDET